MNKKITFPELVELLAQRNAISKRDAEAFLRELITLVTDTLSEGESLRINGLGSFKSQWVEDRASVNVRTGEPYLIPGHYKLSFTPAKAVRDAINEPFACFCVEELPDDAPILTAPDVPEVEDDEVEMPLEQDIPVTPVEPDVVPDATAHARPTPDVVDICDATAAPEEAVTINETTAPAQDNTPDEMEVIEPPREVIDDTPEPDNEALPIDNEVDAMQPPRARRGLWYAGIGVVLVALVALFSLYTHRSCRYVDEVIDTTAEVAPLLQEVILATDEAEATAVADTATEVLPVDVAPVVTDTIRRNIFLTTLSLRHYGHKAFWVYIYEENKHIIANPNNVEIGTVIVIPEPRKYGINAQDTVAVNKALDIARKLKQQMEQ